MRSLLLSASVALLAGTPALAAPGGRLVVCDDTQDPMTLDPHKEFTQRNHTVVQQIYDGLLRFTPDAQIAPALAVSWTRISPTRMRLKLRRGVRFHNGEPLNAEAVRFSINRLIDPKTGYPGLGFMGSLAGAEVVDEHTVDVLTKYPDGLLLNRLAWDVLIVPPLYLHEIGEERFAREPVGTGAFRFVRWEQGKRIVLRANNEHWMSGYPKLDTLEFAFIPDDKQVAVLFRGEVDLLTNLPGTRTEKVESHPKTAVRKGKMFFTVAPALRFDHGPLANRDVRRALNHAIDKKALIRFDLLGNGAAIASTSMPGQGGHAPELKPYRYDPEKARLLLRKAGYEGGLTLKTLVKESSLRTAQIIAANLRDVGVELEITTVTETELRAMAADFKKHGYDIAVSDAPDTLANASFIQSIILYSKSPFSLGADKDFDEKLERMLATVDDAERDKQALEIDRYVHDEALSLFTYQRLKTYGVRHGVDFDHYMNGMPYFFSSTAQ